MMLKYWMASCRWRCYSHPDQSVRPIVEIDSFLMALQSPVHTASLRYFAYTRATKQIARNDWTR